jgi:hypothetical protein
MDFGLDAVLQMVFALVIGLALGLAIGARNPAKVLAGEAEALANAQKLAAAGGAAVGAGAMGLWAHLKAWMAKTPATVVVTQPAPVPPAPAMKATYIDYANLLIELGTLKPAQEVWVDDKLEWEGATPGLRYKKVGTAYIQQPTA